MQYYIGDRDEKHNKMVHFKFMFLFEVFSDWSLNNLFSSISWLLISLYLVSSANWILIPGKTQRLSLFSVNLQTLLSVQFNCSVVSDSLRPHELQHARSPCPSPTPGVHANSCPSSQWCHPAISSSVVPFSSCPQSLPASESFPMSQLFAWGGQSILEFQI